MNKKKANKEKTIEFEKKYHKKSAEKKNGTIILTFHNLRYQANTLIKLSLIVDN